MKQTNKVAGKALLLLALVLLQGCTAMTKLDAARPGSTLAVRGLDRTELPRTEELKSKATGQHEFMAASPTGATLFGILPLRVNGGRMSMSIAFFAPALFGGFRDAFPFYEFDPDEGVLRYKYREQDEWRTYKPTMAESERARQYFEANPGRVAAPAAH